MTWLKTTDQLGKAVELNGPPQRIVSLVPSQTELLFDLGLENEVVGVTRFCIHPSHARKTKAIIGGTKKFDLERIIALNPDLIIGNKEENYIEGITHLHSRYPVWMSDIITMDDAMSMIALVSRITDREKKGIQLLTEIQEKFRRRQRLVPRRALYLMWYKPWMGAGSKTFIDTMMSEAGLINVLKGSIRYPELSAEQIRSLNPELVLLSSEPFPFSGVHAEEISAILPHAKPLLVDGEFFSWYGSRLRLAPAYFDSLQEKLR